MAGYCGHVPGLEHVNGGRSFAKATKKALGRDPVELMRSELIPSSPTSSSKTKVPVDGDAARGHIPGYAGHIPGFQDNGYECGRRCGLMPGCAFDVCFLFFFKSIRSSCSRSGHVVLTFGLRRRECPTVRGPDTSFGATFKTLTADVDLAREGGLMGKNARKAIVAGNLSLMASSPATRADVA